MNIKHPFIYTTTSKLLTYILVICLYFLGPINGWGQSEQASYFGDVHSPRGDLHVLLIFVRYSSADLMKGSKNWPNQSKEGVLPKMAIGEVNDLFHHDPSLLDSISDRLNVSDFYYTMSHGNFRLTGDIFPIQVPVKYIGENRGNFFARQSQMNQAAVNWIAENYPDFDWGKYDQRKNKPGYKFDNSETGPDGVLDYVIFMHRAPGSTGMGSSGGLSIPGSDLKIRNGHTGIRSYTNKEHNWEYFKHEFAHNLYGCPHYLGANGADGDKYYPQKGWGMMAAWHSPFFTANAWESWWMDWMDVQEVKEDGRYRLKDFLTEEDAIRIQIPGTQDYLWIENHQKIDKWDDKIFFKDESKGEPQSAKGIYAYVVAAPGADRSKPRLNPFNRKHANMIKMLNAEGNFDYKLTGESMHTGYFMSPVLEKVAPNPISGQNSFQRIRLDYDSNGKIQVGMAHGNSDGGSKESKELWTEMIDGKAVCHIGCTGDDNDAFGLGDEISLSGQQPVLNYPIYNKKNQSLAPYILNGIQIKVVKEYEDGSFDLDIKLDDWEIRNSQRWCGNIQIPLSEAGRKIILKKKKQLEVDLSGTPIRMDKHEETGTFANPTFLDIHKGNEWVLEKKSTFTLKGYSRLRLREGAQIRLKKRAKLIVEDKASLELIEGSQLILERGSRLILKQGSEFEKGNESVIQQSKGAKIIKQDS